MKKTFAIIILAAAVLSGCGENHFISDRSFRRTVHEDFVSRMDEMNWSKVPFDKTGDAVCGEAISVEEREAMEFLYAYMPLADIADYEPSFYLENVRASFAARREMGWKVPEREFRHFVLPLRVNNESLDSARVVFYRELKPRIEGMGMAEAILEVNHWCHEKVTYQPSDGRTSSPLNLVKNALGRCGEESTFCVAALRSVGIPARQVYTPRWAHTDDNHAWVEAWADGEWHFIGACEPEPVLDLGWFNAPASRAMLTHTKVFGKYDGPEEVVMLSPNYTEVNLIDNYASTARIDFRVLWSEDAPAELAGKPVEGARVDFCIYNYAEFYTAVSKYTDSKGRTFSGAGLGDMLVWASKDGNFGYTRVSFGKDKTADIILSYGPAVNVSSPVGVSESFMLVPPPEDVHNPEVTPEQRAENDKRFAEEDAIRGAYEATFPEGEKARGNWKTIQAFREKPDKAQVWRVLQSLSTKDFHDVTPEILEDYYAASPFLGARVENEFLTPFYGEFKELFPSAFSSPARILQWVKDNITVLRDPKAWNIPMSPKGVFECGMAYPRSRDIFFVSLCRASGFEARKDFVTGKVQYKQDGEWLDVDFDGDASEAKVSAKGTLALAYTASEIIANPEYYRHFTISKIVDGRPRLMAFDEGEVDMGGGMDWAHAFSKGVKLDTGTYMLVSGNRLGDGSVPVSMRFFSIEEGLTTSINLVIPQVDGAVAVIGSFDTESKFAPELSAQTQSIVSAAGRGHYALAVLEPGKEPTNHAMRDIAAAKEKLEAWGRPFILLCKDEAALERLKKETSEGRYGTLPSTVVFGIDSEGIAQGISTALSKSGRLPLVIIGDTFNNVYFYSEGYTIGLGDQIATIALRLLAE